MFKARWLPFSDQVATSFIPTMVTAFSVVAACCFSKSWFLGCVTAYVLLVRFHRSCVIKPSTACYLLKLAVSLRTIQPAVYSTTIVSSPPIDLKIKAAWGKTGESVQAWWEMWVKRTKEHLERGWVCVWVGVLVGGGEAQRCMNGGDWGKAGERQMEVRRSVRSWHVMGHAQVWSYQCVLADRRGAKGG